MFAPRQSPRRQGPISDPLWWAALGLWLVNDHLLKGSGVVDGALTGKLSDFCGLWVLPAGLSALAGRVLGPRAQHWPYYAGVGLYFAGLQLWPGLVHLSEAILGELGVPSKITPDPSDLVALLVLWPAYARYGLPRPNKPALGLRWAVAGYPLMLFATVATSRLDEPAGIQRTGRLFLYNTTNEPQQITIKQVRADVEANCFSIQNDPHKHLHESLFESIETATLGPQGVLAIDARAETNLQSDLPNEQDGCQAMIIGGPKLAPKLLFWKNEQFPLQRFTDVPTDPNQSGIIAIERTASDDVYPFKYRHLGTTQIEHLVMESLPDPASPECASPSPGVEIDWGQAFPKGPHRLESITPGPDGCLALELASQEDTALTTRRYLCIPPKRFPFEPGDILQFRSLEGETPVLGKNIEGWAIRSEKKETEQDDQTDPDENAAIKFYVILGQGLPELSGLTFGIRPQACPYAPSKSDCKTLTRPMDLMAKLSSTGQEILLQQKGELSEHKLSDDTGEWTLELLSCEDRSVFDGACSGDRVRTGTELQLLATWRPKVR